MNKNIMPETPSYLQRFREKFIHSVNTDPSVGLSSLQMDLEDWITQERQQLIQDAVECVPPDKELPKSKCMNAENHLFGSCFECEKIRGWNACREEMLKALTNLK